MRAVAAALDARTDDIVALADAESGLGTARLTGELVRTRIQLEMFADAVAEGSFLDVVIDLPDPDALPAPRPDLRRMMVPLGPVAVFAASNFPLAFSVAGGDTASALAAGCPVVVKAHPSHPGLAALCGQVVSEALAAAGAPAGTFAVVFGEQAGRDLVTHTAITAVVTPGALAARGEQIVAGFVGSYTLGTGQFCTKPGLLFLPAGHGLDAALTGMVAQAPLGPLLNARIDGISGSS